MRKDRADGTKPLCITCTAVLGAMGDSFGAGGPRGATAHAVAAALCVGLELPSPPSCSCVCVVAACAVFELFDAWGRGQRSVAADDEAIVESIRSNADTAKVG